MKVLFELDNGAFVLEVLPKRLYARVEADSDIPTYSDTYSTLITRGTFKEYRRKDKELAFELEDVVKYDLEKSFTKYEGFKDEK